MSNRKAAAVIAGVVLTVGLVVMFLPASISPRGVNIGCGSAVISSSTPGLTDAMLGGGLGLDDQCRDKLAKRRAISFPLVGVGVLALLFVALTANRSSLGPGWEERDEAAREAARRAEQGGHGA